VIATLAVVAAGALGASGASPAPAANPCSPAPVTARLSTNIARPGVISLLFVDAEGSPVTYFECAGDRALPLGSNSAPPGMLTILVPATTWRCDRLVRRFAATAPLADGSVARGAASVRTTSCAKRFELGVPRRVAPGGAARVRIVDRWAIGDVRTSLCIGAPRARLVCRRLAFAQGARLALRQFRPAARGRWRVELRVAGHRVRASIAVGVRGFAPKAAPPAVLVTGDSSMQGIDSFLADELGDAATVVSDVRPGAGISAANAWWPIAKAQAARVRPRSTVISLGSNEGFPMRAADGASHACCDAAWIGEYERRVRKAMSFYAAGGRGRVYWLTIPAPRDERRVPIVAAVNTAILKAAAGFAGARALRMDLLFSPDGYRDVIRYEGHDVHVREPDGVHLDVAGTRIAAEAVARALRGR
jgi:hypothetical protein